LPAPMVLVLALAAVPRQNPQQNDLQVQAL
jgi:hypothetical protein